MGKGSRQTDFDLNETIVSLLLPIGRLMLKGGFSVTDLVKAGKDACVRAAIEQIIADGFRVNASHLSVITGLTRKEVTAILGELSGKKRGFHSRAKEQRAFRVIRAWKVDNRFRAKNGEPATLPERGSVKSFSALVREYGGDVTPKAVLRELQRMRLVTIDKSGHLKLRSIPAVSKSTDHMDTLARLFPDFADTVAARASVEPPLFFGYRSAPVESPQQAGRFQRTFSSRASALLDGVQQWMPAAAKKEKIPGGYRVGVGVYLVQNRITDEKAAVQRPRISTNRAKRTLIPASRRKA